jgi:uncharacterized protein involved in outer membrane biogenesis
VVFIASAIAITTFKKDEIIQYFVAEANKNISTPIEVEKIDISLFSHFPSISINLDNVTIRESYSENKGILGRAKKISFSFSLFDLLNKKYVVHSLYISDAEINLVVNIKGQSNYMIIRSDSTKRGSLFELNNITGKNLNIHYRDMKSDYEVKLSVQSAQSSISQKGEIMSVIVDGDLVSDEIRVGKRTFLDNKNITIDTDLEIDVPAKNYDFKSCLLAIDRGKFELGGNVNASEKTLDLTLNGVNTTFRTINSLLSSDLSAYLKDYNSRGDVYFSGRVSGSYKQSQRPDVNLEFGAKNASFFHPRYKKEIEQVNLLGSFTTGKINNPANYRLELKNFNCQLDKKTLEGQLILQNFNAYKLDLSLKGEADINSLALLFPADYLKAAFGSVKMNVHINGEINSTAPARNFNADGDVTLNNVSFVLTGERLPFNKINGTLSLRKNDLAVSNLTGSVGQSDFNVNGFLKDFSGLLMTKDKPIKLQADLRSRHIDFDELLKSNFASRDTLAGKDEKYEFVISPRVSIDFNCEVNNLKFRRFNGQNIRGQLEINNQIAILKNVSISSMGGRIVVSGSVNNKKENLVETITTASLYNISIDSVFYVFKNFNQTWLTDKNLKGQLDADVNLYMNFDKNLILNSKSLVADIKTSIINGELNDFEPMMKLSKFVEEESLAQMRFSRMMNNIRIENRVIYLPEMEIRSNVSNILVKGQHSFNKEIDYRLQVPLKNFIRISKKKDYEQSARHGMNLMLKITGTTSDYKISYDADALKESIRNDVLDEAAEWKNLRNGNIQSKEEIPELEDEYFEFEEDLNDSTSQNRNQ